MILSDQLVNSFQVVRVFQENTNKVNSIDFSTSGKRLISSNVDDQILMYDCEKLTLVHKLNVKKYGADLIRFTHAKNTVVHSSSKVNNAIRYLSLYDNKYIRYFTGHSEKVVSLCLSPVDDTFLSGSLDKSMRLWELRSPNCLRAFYNLPERPIIAYHPAGLVFAVGYNSRIKLFDLRYIDNGPFVSFRYDKETECDWTGLKFSKDGNMILINTNGSIIRLIDAYKGTRLQTLTGHVNNMGIPIDASFGPDSQFVFSGSTDGRVHAWNTSTGYKVCVFNAIHPGPVQSVQFNPKYMMFASACTKMALWVPSCKDT